MILNKYSVIKTITPMVQSKEINFDGQNIYIGIDVHLKTWNVTIITQSGYKKEAFSEVFRKRAL